MADANAFRARAQELRQAARDVRASMAAARSIQDGLGRSLWSDRERAELADSNVAAENIAFTFDAAALSYDVAGILVDAAVWVLDKLARAIQAIVEELANVARQIAQTAEMAGRLVMVGGEMVIDAITGDDHNSSAEAYRAREAELLRERDRLEEQRRETEMRLRTIDPLDPGLLRSLDQHLRRIA